MTIYSGFKPKADVDRLYLPRKEVGRGLIVLEDCIELGKSGLECYLKNSEERLIVAYGGNQMKYIESAYSMKRKS